MIPHNSLEAPGFIGVIERVGSYTLLVIFSIWVLYSSSAPPFGNKLGTIQISPAWDNLLKDVLLYYIKQYPHVNVDLSVLKYLKFQKEFQKKERLCFFYCWKKLWKKLEDCLHRKVK